MLVQPTMHYSLVKKRGGMEKEGTTEEETNNEDSRRKKRALATLASSLVSSCSALFLLPSLSSSLLLSQHPPHNKSLLHLQFPLLLSHLLSFHGYGSNHNRSLKRKHEEEGSKTELNSTRVSEDETTTRRRRWPENPDEFRSSFLMTSSTFQYLSGLLEPLLDCEESCSSGKQGSGKCDDLIGKCYHHFQHLHPTIRLAVALCRLATGFPYDEVALRFGVTVPTARFCTKRLCRVLCTNFRFWLAFPSDFSPQQGVDFGLPGFCCCGSICSTSFRISDGSSVQAQLVSNPDCKILNLAVGQRVRLDSSSLYRDVQSGKLFDPDATSTSPCSTRCCYLVGGYDYPLLPWLMVPFDGDHLPNSKEEHFNIAHRSMLRSAIRTLKSLRNWGILKGPVVDEDKKMAVACIATCSILHNMLLTRGDFSALSNGDIVDAPDDVVLHSERLNLETSDQKEALNLRMKLAESAAEKMRKMQTKNLS